MNRIALDLQYFAEEGAAAAEAPAAAESTGSAAAETGTAGVPVREGDTLADGTRVPTARVAAALEKQMKRHPELRQVYGQGQAQPVNGQQAQSQQTEQTIQEKWEQLKKGEFKDLYGADVQDAIQKRFKNQKDSAKELEELQPMLQALMQKAGVETVKDLSDIVLDDDSLYEDEAEERGMTVEALKHMKALEEEHEKRKAQDEQDRQEQMFRAHIAGLAQQAEQMKQVFPDFNLDREMQNETFMRLTAPDVGLSVEDAYFAVHRRELAPQMMAYGMNRARQQMSQTIQAQRQRPAEGAMRSQQQAAEMKLDPRNLTRKERDRIRNLIHTGRQRVTFD